jgi:histidyl-tRNA synthetase
VDGGGVGFGMGIERLILILEAQGKLPHIPRDIKVFVGGMGEAGAARAAQVVYDLRKAGISAISDLCERSVKGQLKYADKLGAKYSLVIGETELKSGRATVKDMQSGEATEIDIDKIVDFFRRKP